MSVEECKIFKIIYIIKVYFLFTGTTAIDNITSIDLQVNQQLPS